MTRGRWIALAVVLTLAAGGGGFAFWYCLVEPIQYTSRWHQQVMVDLEQVQTRRPPDVSPERWEFAVGWTINLHCNCGVVGSNPDRAWCERFAEELEQRLQGPITLADIDWIWDEYAAHTPNGASYSDKHRPTRPDAYGRP